MQDDHNSQEKIEKIKGGGSNSMLKRFAAKNPHRIATAALIVVICSLISHFYLISNNNIEEIYQDETKNAIIELKKSFLKNTVDNLILEIETSRKMEAERYKRIVDRRYETLDSEKYLTENEFADYFITRFSSDSDREGDLNYWTVFLWNNISNTVLYDPDGLFDQDISTALGKIKPVLSYYRVINHEGISGLFGVSREYIEDKVKASAAAKIKSLKFDNDSYIWVNEVINYEGGKNYAIRRIHPGLPETEGMYLSTDMRDIKGNLPYLAELEGIKKDGELFFRYYFKELNRDIISEKLSYAKLYKEYDWIVAMGVQINEMEKYIDLTNERSKKVAAKSTLQLLIILIIVVILCLALIMLMEKWRFRHTKKQLESEINIDPLTNAGSRRYGTKDLIKAFNEFKLNGSKPAIMMFDIDNFKYINDNFGHDVGDQILKEVVGSVFKTIRSVDRLIRWGGDEFIGIFYGVKEGNAVYFADKILKAVSSLTIIIGNETISPTISIGISYFKESDADFSDVLKRADQAMYKSKAENRNKINIL